MIENDETTDEVRAEHLTKEHVKALRDANHFVVLRHMETNDWVGTLEVQIRKKEYGQEVDVRIEIRVASCITNYEEGRASDHPRSEEEIAALKLRASYLINWPHENGGTWRTLVGLVKEGDVLQVHWTRGNHNAITRESGLAVDHVMLSIERGYRRVGMFLIGYSVGRKNTARMITSKEERGGWG